jgi:predicted cobalt transporter CbtA
MIFKRLIWAGLAVALLVGSVQTGVQRWQAAPLILAAEVYEEQKAEAPQPPEALTAHTHAEGVAPEHEHAPKNGSRKTVPSASAGPGSPISCTPSAWRCWCLR